MNIITSQKTLAAARDFRDRMYKTITLKCPLRFRPVIIAAETEGFFRVVEYGFALENHFPIVN